MTRSSGEGIKAQILKGKNYLFLESVELQSWQVIRLGTDSELAVCSQSQ
jgi:hypothetical protein